MKRKMLKERERELGGGGYSCFYSILDLDVNHYEWADLKK
jgi:hypothetical protein